MLHYTFYTLYCDHKYVSSKLQLELSLLPLSPVQFFLGRFTNYNLIVLEFDVTHKSCHYWEVKLSIYNRF